MFSDGELLYRSSNMPTFYLTPARARVSWESKRDTRRLFREVKPVNNRQAKRFAEEPELISIKATAALLGDVSERTVRRLVWSGRIEAVKVGARVMPRLTSVRSFARGG
jgi:hypothetical protein